MGGAVKSIVKAVSGVGGGAVGKVINTVSGGILGQNSTKVKQQATPQAQATQAQTPDIAEQRRLDALKRKRQGRSSLMFGTELGQEQNQLTNTLG